MDEAVTNALRNRADLARARKDTENAQTSLRLATNQKLPDVRVNASYQASGLGGTEVMRSGGFPGTIVGPGQVTSFASILDQLARSNYPTWAMGVSVSYPFGQSSEEAIHARSVLEAQQAAHRVKTAEARAVFTRCAACCASSSVRAWFASSELFPRGYETLTPMAHVG